MKNTLKKVLVELQKENPDLSYIRGMLEVLIGEDEPTTQNLAKNFGGNPPTNGNVINPYTEELIEQIDEASILNAKAKAHIERFGMPQQNG